jgi:NAD(P)-dependent dehydrogenase (short-subunit alcohol dehydrogenase family)
MTESASRILDAPRGPFGATSTTDDVLAGRDLSGKRVLVTGVSAGLGVETAGALAAHGARVVGAARDLAKAERATAQVRADGAKGGWLELVELDLASLASVRTCADKLLKAGEPLDLVIANAGVMATPLGRTADGFETQFGTNHRPLRAGESTRRVAANRWAPGEPQLIGAPHRRC